MSEKLWDCPGEAHELDMGFSPSLQGPYGPGYHYCDVCDGDNFVTKEVYYEELERQEEVKRRMEERKRWKEEQKVIDALKNSKGTIVDFR